MTDRVDMPSQRQVVGCAVAILVAGVLLGMLILTLASR